MNTRRDFLAGATALFVAGALPGRREIEAVTDTQTPIPDRFALEDWDIVWSGWKPCQDQNVLIGHWFAHSPSADWASCTLGATHQYRPLHMLDATYSPEHGMLITQFSTDADREQARRQAMKRLLVSLKTGAPFGRVYES